MPHYGAHGEELTPIEFTLQHTDYKSVGAYCKFAGDNACNPKLFAMKGFHHPDGSQQAFLTGLAHLYNLVPYQRRAQHAGQCGVEVEGGTVPTRDWFLNLQILTSGGFR